jgi:hypothetical protein
MSGRENAVTEGIFGFGQKISAGLFQWPDREENGGKVRSIGGVIA